MGELTKALEKIGLDMRVTALVSIKWRVVLKIVLLITYPDILIQRLLFSNNCCWIL